MSKSHGTNRQTVISQPQIHRTDITKQDVKLTNEDVKYHNELKKSKLDEKKINDFMEEEIKENSDAKDS